MDGVHALTDVTGFGLAGHLLEICRASGVGALVDFARVPLHPDAGELARAGCVTGASARNWAGYGPDVTIDAPDADLVRTLVTDPQTSGGLLVACAARDVDAVLEIFRGEGFAHAADIGDARGGRAARGGPPAAMKIVVVVVVVAIVAAILWQREYSREARIERAYASCMEQFGGATPQRPPARDAGGGRGAECDARRLAGPGDAGPGQGRHRGHVGGGVRRGARRLPGGLRRRRLPERARGIQVSAWAAAAGECRAPLLTETRTRSSSVGRWGVCPMAYRASAG